MMHKFFSPTGGAGAALLILALLAGAAEVEPVKVTGKIQWTYSYEEGQKLARQNGQPLLVVFRCER